VTVIRVLLADDQELVRAGLRLMIDRAPGLTVVAEAATGTEAVRLAREARADVVLMDIRMPGLDGLSATRRITAEESLAGVKVLILTTFEVDEYVFEALRSGASGFLGKGARPDVLIEAIRTVARGDALLSPAATRGLIARYLEQHEPTAAAGAPGALGAPGSALVETLTDREREVVRLIAEGMSNAEIADQLSLSPLTVKTHANHAMTKLGARDRAQLVVLAYQAGLPGPSHAPASALASSSDEVTCPARPPASPGPRRCNWESESRGGPGSEDGPLSDVFPARASQANVM
jgi:DNA-binding NarL/FixJ family response regulator